ncbi:MAG: hypothetical protein DMF06_16465 [Verrucomicrobia bacterium]|nr:MAG: hypothetical protein DMF06_16465 [Verrucomicrobiota bacterium]
MTGELVIISPELGSGGIGDYTRRLLEHLPQIGGLRLVIPAGGNMPANSFGPYPVEAVDARADALRNKLPRQGGKVFVQYSGYGFQRFGYPRWLINALIDWKEESQGFLAIMFHEIWTFWPVWNKNYLIQQLHRRDIGRLLRVTDKTLTSTSGQAKDLAALWPGSKIQVLPVGSNIHRVCLRDDARQPGVAVLFGLQFSRIRALRKMEAELKALSHARKLRKVVVIGAGSSPQGEEEERRRLLALGLSEGFDQRGPLPENEITNLLSTAAFAIWAQGELSVTKSGTFMACAAHGLNIISCYADAVKPEPLSLLVSPHELMEEITTVELHSRAARLREWQARTSAWPSIASEIARALDIEIPAP